MSHISFNIVDCDVNFLRNANATFDIAYITDPDIRGLYQWDPTDTTSSDDGVFVLVSNNGKRFKFICGELIQSTPTGASTYTTNAEDIIFCSNTVMKTITISAKDIQHTYRRKTLSIIDTAGDALNTSIIIQGAGGAMINGLSTIEIGLNYGSKTLTSDGSNLYTIGSF